LLLAVVAHVIQSANSRSTVCCCLAHSSAFQPRSTKHE